MTNFGECAKQQNERHCKCWHVFVQKCKYGFTFLQCTEWKSLKKKPFLRSRTTCLRNMNRSDKLQQNACVTWFAVKRYELDHLNAFKRSTFWMRMLTWFIYLDRFKTDIWKMVMINWNCLSCSAVRMMRCYRGRRPVRWQCSLLHRRSLLLSWLKWYVLLKSQHVHAIIFLL